MSSFFLEIINCNYDGSVHSKDTDETKDRTKKFIRKYSDTILSPMRNKFDTLKNFNHHLELRIIDQSEIISPLKPKSSNSAQFFTTKYNKKHWNIREDDIGKTY